MALLVPLLAAVPFALMGWHLLSVFRRSRAVPDALLCGFAGAVAVGTPCRMAAVDLVTSGSGLALAHVLHAAANAVFGAAVLCLAAFTWLVFRPDSSWARRAFWVYVGAFSVVIFGAIAIDLQSDASRYVSALVYNAIGIVPLWWAFAECVSYYRAMRRRQALGLADPLIVDRFMLWSVWTGGLGFLMLAILGLRVSMLVSGASAALEAGALDPRWIGAITAVRLSVLVVGPIAAASCWLSFSPPTWYRRWVEARAGGVATA